MVYEREIKGVWISAGASLSAFGLGFGVSRYSLTVDIGFWWFSLEWWPLRK